MKTLTIILSLFSLAVFSQEPAVPSYTLAIPEKWGTETIPFPISFAPQIAYTGVEDVRFSPGWGKAKSEEYWSYAFLWYLNGKIKITPAALDSNMKYYYAGLIAGNGPNIPAEKLIPVTTSFKKMKKAKGDAETYSGTIHMTDYMQQKPIMLNVIVHLKYAGNKTLVFFELSPQPSTYPIWKDLHKLWLDLKCK